MSTRDLRRRILELLRVQGDYIPPRTYTRAQRMRIVEVLRLEAGLPARPPATSPPGPRPHGRPRAEVIDLSQFEADRARWEARDRRRRQAYAKFGLVEDLLGRVHCMACGEWVPASTRGITGGSPKALGLWHAFHCKAGGR